MRPNGPRWPGQNAKISLAAVVLTGRFFIASGSIDGAMATTRFLSSQAGANCRL
jgi:hypothetical protein